MDTKIRTILVLWDFTQKAEFAFAHAVNVSRITGNDVALLHIVKSENQVEEVQKRLNEVAETLNTAYQIKPKTVILKGSIFKTVSKYASEGGTELVVMGTHGIKGFQRITGSWALKVIRGSRVPFLVVQDMPNTSKIDNIVFPIDFKKENKEKIRWAHYLCNIYHSRIHIIHPLVKDRTFKKRIYSNIVFAKKYFDNTDINFEIKAMERNVKFADGTIGYAESVKANLILIMTSKTLTLADYIMGPSEQFLIANYAKIPVMVVNPRPKAFAGGFSATGG
jgi:nucleotide-binding universal stress UspA family protein